MGAVDSGRRPGRGTQERPGDSLGATFGDDLERHLDAIRPDYRFDVTCQGSVPESLIGFLESGDYEDSVRYAVSLGGGSDTMACIAGGIPEARYGPLPERVTSAVADRLDEALKGVLDAFRRTYGLP